MRTLKFKSKEEFEILYEALFSFDTTKVTMSRKTWLTLDKIVNKFETLGTPKIPIEKRLDIILLTTLDNVITLLDLEDTEFELLSNIFDAVTWAPLGVKRVAAVIKLLESTPHE